MGKYVYFAWRKFWCLFVGHNIKDKGWGVRSCRRCGQRGL